ncbi:molecular chaperone DnaJ [Microbacterium lacus]|uniref:molecular chaperone DnaJ n=1 Tax=Microbacterium lacus TaxID=415217 RepID=UPI000C2C6633|nr:molecular chaperone DnaJ [Microbacterium lacus]
MSAWPDKMTVAPIGEWPGLLTKTRKSSPFRTTLTETLKLLDRETWHLAATDAQIRTAELLIAVPAGQFRIDGRPRADARPEHPGVIFSMDSRHGRLSYPCDTFTTWQDNLRAIALALEALRKVDRYGVTKRGEQYRGFLALEATAAPAGFATAEDALRFLREISGVAADVYEAPEVHLPRVIRRARRAAHPDMGGDADTFQRVSLAEAKLREAGRL